jgi:O-antigen biosynthesis protein
LLGLRLPPAGSVQIELLTEPMTEWTMVGAGAAWDSPEANSPMQAELWIDGQHWVDSPLSRTETGYRFGLHAPLPKNANLINVRLRFLNSQECCELVSKTAAELVANRTVQPVKAYPRWLSPAMTLGKSLASGEAFTPKWWTARYERYRSLAIKTRQQVRDKLAFREERFRPCTTHEAYCRHSKLTPAEVEEFRTQLLGWKQKPLISVVMPVYNVNPAWLLEAVGSVRQQIYPHWQLCIADDASTKPETVAALNSLPTDERIKLVRRAQNGHICAATNSAAELATGEFIAFMDNDDLLAPQALFRVVEAMQAAPEWDLIYSDEDKITEAGHRYDPQFKPDWSPELLLSYNYINHLTVVRKKLFEQVGGLRIGYEGSQDHDLLLRLTEKTDRVHHLCEILYHWRAHSGSTASTASQKPIVETSGRRGLTDALNRRGVQASVVQPSFAERLKLPILVLDEPANKPTVAILIYGSADEAGRSVRAIKQHTQYPGFNTYLVLDEQSPADGLNRLAAARDEEYLLILQAGLEPRDPRWLSQLVANAQLPGVGVVGAKIEEPDGRIISAGTVLKLGEDHLPGDAFRGLKPEPVSYYFYAEVTRNVTAPARGCLLTARRHFEQLGGLDSRHYPKTTFDLDYSLRLSGQGLRSVQVGNAVLQGHPDIHGRYDAPTELHTLRQAYGVNSDQYHNPNLSNWEPFEPVSRAATSRPSSSRFSWLIGTHNLSAFEGAPKIVMDVATQLQRQGRASASFFAPQPGKSIKHLEAEQIRVFAELQPFSKHFTDCQWTPIEYEAAQSYLKQIFSQVKPDVVLAGTLGLFPLVDAATRWGIPSILAIQESYSESLFNKLLSPYARWRCERAFHFADRVLFASKTCQALYSRLNTRKNFEIIHNGLDASRFAEYQHQVSRAEAEKRVELSPTEKLRIVSVGTVCERKAQHHLVEAASLLKQRGRDFTVYLVGAREGVPYLSFIRNLIRTRGLEEHVKVIPETDQVWAYLRASDIYACCSYIEAHSLAILESQAFGLPLVSTPCGGLDEQVIWNQSALKYDFGDVSRLAEQLERLLTDQVLRLEMARQAKAQFELHMDSQETADRYTEVLLQVQCERRTESVTHVVQAGN